MNVLVPYPRRTLSCILLLLAGAIVSGQEIVLRLRVFPPQAELRLDGEVLPYRDGGDAWREYVIAATESAVPEIAAPGYRERPLHLIGLAEMLEAGTLELEERLVPLAGPLVSAGEFPTGESPKSVIFLPGNRLAVPLLRDRGTDFYRWYRQGRALQVQHLGRGGPNGDDAETEIAFVEPLLLSRRGELWISRMDPDEIHRFDLLTRQSLGSIPSGGMWPKAMLTDAREEYVYVANWFSETVTVLDSSSGTVMRTIAVGGQPRGLWLAPDQRFLWVCLFSTGDIEIIDLQSGRVQDRLGLPHGAARHIAAPPDGSLIYYSDMFHGTVSTIDPVSRRVIRSRRVGPNVNTIVLDPRGEFVFVSVRGRNNREDYLLPGPEYGRIVVLDARTLEEVQSVWARRQPTGLAVSPDGTLLAATDFLDNNLALYEIRR